MQAGNMTPGTMTAAKHTNTRPSFNNLETAVQRVEQRALDQDRWLQPYSVHLPRFRDLRSATLNHWSWDFAYISSTSPSSDSAAVRVGNSVFTQPGAMSSNVRGSSPCRAAKLNISWFRADLLARCPLGREGHHGRSGGAADEGLEPNGLSAVLVLRRFADPTLPVPPRIADPR
ncbi:hypothetical protein [Nocardia salmonicida]|uniref:hypothetical protein n=1 Tax=Nocardia salmonicida TaxID=53431 RepID=UPI0007A5178D|nr:hypothetical protein [Nocardia salmonicida]